MNNPKGIAYAALSSSTFGLAPLFTVTLLRDGFSPFEVLTYRWGVASAALLLFGLATGRRLRIARRDFGVVFLLSLFRAGCSLSLVFAYANIATGVASTIHFLYPLAVALAMTLFFRERCSRRLFTAIAVSLAGAALLSSGDIRSNGGDATFGIAAAFFSVISYAGYIIGVRKSRAAQVESTTLTLLVMAIGAALFAATGSLTSGLHWVDDSRTWGNILGLAIPATAVSNIALVKAIKAIGPTLTSILGAMEPLTAVLIGVLHFGEPFTAAGIAGVELVRAASTHVATCTPRTSRPWRNVLRQGRLSFSGDRPTTRPKGSVVDVDQVEFQVERQLQPVGELHLVIPFVAVDLDDGRIGIVLGNVLRDLLRDDRGRNRRIFAVDLFPVAVFQEFDLGTAGEDHLVGRIEEFALHLGEGDLFVGEMLADELLRLFGQFADADRTIVVGTDGRGAEGEHCGGENQKLFHGVSFF